MGSKTHPRHFTSREGVVCKSCVEISRQQEPGQGDHQVRPRSREKYQDHFRETRRGVVKPSCLLVPRADITEPFFNGC